MGGSARRQLAAGRPAARRLQSLSLYGSAQLAEQRLSSSTVQWRRQYNGDVTPRNNGKKQKPPSSSSVLSRTSRVPCRVHGAGRPAAICILQPAGSDSTERGSMEGGSLLSSRLGSSVPPSAATVESETVNFTSTGKSPTVRASLLFPPSISLSRSVFFRGRGTVTMETRTLISTLV